MGLCGMGLSNTILDLLPFQKGSHDRGPCPAAARAHQGIWAGGADVNLNDPHDALTNLFGGQLHLYIGNNPILGPTKTNVNVTRPIPNCGAIFFQPLGRWERNLGDSHHRLPFHDFGGTGKPPPHPHTQSP